jgi:hypothetical protein
VAEAQPDGTVAVGLVHENVAMEAATVPLLHACDLGAALAGLIEALLDQGGDDRLLAGV